MKYWFGKYKRALNNNTIILTSFNPVKDITLDINDVLESMQQLIDLSKLKGFFKLRNPRYIGFTFADKETKNVVEKNLLRVGLNNVLHLAWVSEVNIIDLKLLWLPPIVTHNHITKALDQFVKILSIVEETTNCNNNLSLTNGNFVLKAQLLRNITPDTIPHIMLIDGFQALIIIKGREPICLNCEKLGHLSFRCPNPYCKQCHECHPYSFKCQEVQIDKSSYANKVKIKKSFSKDSAVHMSGWAESGGGSQDISTLGKPQSQVNVLLNRKVGNDNMASSVQSTVEPKSAFIGVLPGQELENIDSRFYGEVQGGWASSVVLTDLNIVEEPNSDSSCMASDLGTVLKIPGEVSGSLQNLVVSYPSPPPADDCDLKLSHTSNEEVDVDFKLGTLNSSVSPIGEQVDLMDWATIHSDEDSTSGIDTRVNHFAEEVEEEVFGDSVQDLEPLQTSKRKNLSDLASDLGLLKDFKHVKTYSKRTAKTMIIKVENRYDALVDEGD